MDSTAFALGTYDSDCLFASSPLRLFARDRNGDSGLAHDGVQLYKLTDDDSAHFVAATYGLLFEAARVAASWTPHQYESACDAIATFVVTESAGSNAECSKFGVAWFETCDDF